MRRNAQSITEIYQALRPLILRDFGIGGAATSSGNGGGMEAHDLAGPWHMGTLLESQAPWAATKTEWEAALVAHAALPDVHHAAVTAGTLIGVTGQQVNLANGSAQYQVPVTGASPYTPAWAALSSFAGNGLSFSGGQFAVGAGTLITVGATSVGLANGSAQYQVPVTGTNPYTPAYTALSSFAGNGLSFSGGQFVVGVANTGAVGLSVESTLVRLTSSSDPGANARILASDASGGLTLVQLTGTTRVRTPLLDTAAGMSITISPALDLILNPGSGLVRMASGDAIQASSYASQTTGWRITDVGEADFRYLFADEMHVKNFIVDLEQALAGGQIISKSVAMLATNFVLPAAGATGTLRVRDLPSAQNMPVFQSGDFVGLRQFSRAGGSLTVAWAWGTVTAYADGTGANEGTQTWTFTRHATTPGTASGTIYADSLVLDFGTSGNGYYEVNAIDGLYALNSPYAQVVTWQTHPATQTVRARFGNLRGITNVTGEYGIFAGSGTAATDRYIRASSTAIELRNVPLALYDGANNTALLTAGAGNNAPTFAMGSPLPTAPLTGTGVWMGLSGGAYQFRVGSISGGALSQGLHWDGSNLTVRGTIVVTGSFSGVNYAGASTPGGPANSIVGQGALATANSAAWGSQVSGRPTELTDGRVATAIAAGGIVQSRVDPEVNWGANPGAGYAGLLLGADYMGYWTGSAWRTYIDNAGRFYVNAGAGSNYMSWNGSTLTVSGTINVIGGNAATTTYVDTADAGKANTSLNNSAISTLINGANIRVGSGNKDTNLNGWNIDSGEIVGQENGVDQVVFNTSGQIVAGAGNVVISRGGIAISTTTENANAMTIGSATLGYYNNNLWIRPVGNTSGIALAPRNSGQGGGYNGLIWIRQTDYETQADIEAATINLSGAVAISSTLTVTGNIGSAWTNLTLTSPWVNKGAGWATAQYCRFGDWVMIKGLVKPSVNVSAGATILTLPSNIRPSEHRRFVGTAADVATNLDVLSTGIVSVNHPVNVGQVASIECIYKL